MHPPEKHFAASACGGNEAAIPNTWWVCVPACCYAWVAAGGMCAISYSANAVIVSAGFTPGLVQLYAQDESTWDNYLRSLAEYVRPRAQGSAFTEFYLRFFGHHLRAIAKPGGLFEGTTVTRLPWRGQVRRVRMVVYRRSSASAGVARRGQSPEQALTTICDRLAGGLANAGVKTRRMLATDIHEWLLRWFNPYPTLLGPSPEDRERFYALTYYPEETQEGEIELASGDFSQRLFFTQLRSDVANGTWLFDGMPHRIIVTDRLRMPPATGHITGETRKGGDAVNALFDQMPEDTVMCLTVVATPQDVLEAHLNHLSRKAVLEMADAMDMFCQGVDGEMFDRPSTPWPEADITIVDLATFAREGYNAQLSIAYISLINTVNNIAERDQFLGRPIINVTDEGRIITKNPLLATYVVKIAKMWRKLGAWYWLATQNIDDLPKAAEPMLNMIEWWICLSMPPDEVEKIARFRELNPAQKALMLSARKESGKFTEGVILFKSMEVLFRAVPPSLYLALAQTEPEEKAERFQLMQQYGIGELDAAFKIAEKIDRARGIDPPSLRAEDGAPINAG